MIYSLGQAALSEVLSLYDTSSEIVGVGGQIYRRKHRAPKEYQTALGPVIVARHVYVNCLRTGQKIKTGLEVAH